MESKGTVVVPSSRHGLNFVILMNYSTPDESKIMSLHERIALT